MSYQQNTSLRNNNEDIKSLIDQATTPVLILVVAEGCEEGSSPAVDEFRRTLDTHELDLAMYEMCIPTNEKTFPEVRTPALYFFLPGQHDPVFWRGEGFMRTLTDDLTILQKMVDGSSYVEARFSEEERNTISAVDSFFEAEKSLEMPSVLKQARSLAKTVWTMGKGAATGLPVIVPAEVGLERLLICEACPLYNLQTNRCSECGCFMKVKTQIATATCPKNKWGRYDNINTHEPRKE